MKEKIEVQNVVYTIQTLYDLCKKGDVRVPDYQRGYVWNKQKADRFIDTILQGYPMPPLFFNEDYDTGVLYITDGNQRLNTILSFKDNDFEGRKNGFILGKASEYKGKRYKRLDSVLKRSFDNYQVPCIIFSTSGDARGLSLEIFDRINNGVTALTAQELRHGLYKGTLTEFLDDICDRDNFVSILGKFRKRRKDNEIILRIMALYARLTVNENPSVRSYLDNFIHANQYMPKDNIGEYDKLFSEAIKYAKEYLPEFWYCSRETHNFSLGNFESIMIAIMKGMSSKKLVPHDKLTDSFENLVNDTSYQESFEHINANSLPYIKSRINKAIKYFTK